MERPRERFLTTEIDMISNEDLLAILLKSGPKGESAKTIAMELLKLYESLHSSEELTIAKLTEIKGIGEVKAITILAALEFGKRMYEKRPRLQNQVFSSSQIVYEYYRSTLVHKKQEIELDYKKRIIKEKLLFIGTINHSTIHPREIFKEACLVSASTIICVHNHPSGNPIPSTLDFQVTEQLVKIGIFMGIPLIDHIIIGESTYYSFFENNDMKAFHDCKNIL